MFHVSQLKKCLHVLEEQIPLEELTIKEDLTYEEFPVKILEMAERVTMSRIIKICKVQWNRYTEDTLKYTHGFLSKHRPNLEDEIHFKGGRIVTP